MTDLQKALRHFITYHTDIVYILLQDVGGEAVMVTLEDGSVRLFKVTDNGILEFLEQGEVLFAQGKPWHWKQP